MDHHGRYDLHELLRQYAEERLQETADETEGVYQRHSRYMLSFLGHKEKDLEGKQQKEALEEIQREIDNVRAAWQWAVEHKREEEIAGAAHALWFFYDTRGWYTEGEQAFRAPAEALGMNGSEEKKEPFLGNCWRVMGDSVFP